MTKVDGSVIYVNQAYLKESGYAENEMIGNSVFNFAVESGIKTLKKKSLQRFFLLGNGKVKWLFDARITHLFHQT